MSCDDDFNASVEPQILEASFVLEESVAELSAVVDVAEVVLEATLESYALEVSCVVEESVSEVLASIEEVAGPPGAPGAAAIVRESLTGSPDGVKVDFTASNAIPSGTELVMVNGLVQDSPDHYTLSGNTVTFSDPPEDADSLEILYQISV